MKSSWRFAKASDASLLVEVADELSPAASRRVIALFHALQAARAPFVVDLHPAYTSVLVAFDLARADHARVERFVARVAARTDAAAPARLGRTVSVPVVYDGPDLDDVARAAGLSPHEVATLHAGARYRVAFLGFLPGFAYLLGLPRTLATPRLVSARPRVPAGSVAIGGAQTAIYPVDGPGGWRLIGRTAVDPATLLAPGWVEPGDTVRFVPVRSPT